MRRLALLLLAVLLCSGCSLPPKGGFDSTDPQAQKKHERGEAIGIIGQLLVNLLRGMGR